MLNMPGPFNPPALPLLRAPPFPYSKFAPIARSAPAQPEISNMELNQAAKAIAKWRVGGSYWGAQPTLPPSPYILVGLRDDHERARLLEGLPSGSPIICWTPSPVASHKRGAHEATWLSGCCDPWHLVEGAREVFSNSGAELALIAALAGRPVHRPAEDALAALFDDGSAPVECANLNFAYFNPFTGEQMRLMDAVELCGFWRKLIDSNRPIVTEVGFASWKRRTASPLLWAGSGRVPFARSSDTVKAGQQVAVWKARVPPATLERLDQSSAHLIEVEDGFIRSVGLGADCIPPLSLVVDRMGAYFDPARPSELEQLIETGNFAADLIARASALRSLIVALGVSKYGSGQQPLTRRTAARQHLLIPGQVEDDRSVLCGGGPIQTNVELLRRVRSSSPDGFIIYKPHPDVEAGHRAGAIPDEIAIQFADEVMRGHPISSLIDLVDEVHVNTSLAGFEALLREKPVVTHGVPFYAGWGLTRDLGPVPRRRTAKRTLDELVAATLLLYPRYLDPLTGLPCPPEVLVHRLANNNTEPSEGVLVKLRRIQGRLKRQFGLPAAGRNL